MPPKGYTSLSLRDNLLEKVDSMIQKLHESGLGPSYRGRAHFVEAATNELIEKLSKTYFLGEPRGEQ